jgi:hypothetical protein
MSRGSTPSAGKIFMANDDSFRQPTTENPYFAPQATADVGGYVTSSALTLNPWTSIWFRPRATIRQIVDMDPTYMVLPLAAAAGIGRALGRTSRMPQSDDLPLPVILAILAVVGSLMGLVTVYIAGWLLRWTASWLGGMATSQQTRAAIAWGQIPLIAAIPVLLTLIALFGLHFFDARSPETEWQAQLWPAKIVGGGLSIVLSVWSLFTLLKCLAEVHQFSAWRALGASILACLVSLALVFVPILLFGILAGIAVGGR